jgi:hypothetical protein
MGLLRIVMRVFLLATILAELATACTTELVSVPPPPPVDWPSLEVRPKPSPAAALSPTEMERAAAAAYTAALASPRLEKLGPLLVDEVHFRFTDSKDVYGKENVLNAHLQIFGPITDQRIETSRVLLTESSQVIEWKMTAALRSAPITISGLSLLWTQDDASISDMHLYFGEVSGKEGALQSPTSPPVFEQARSPNERANVELVRSMIKALEGENEAAYLEPLAEEIEILTLRSGELLRGKTAARSYFRGMRDAVSMLSTSVENIWGIGPFVAVEYQIRGDLRGRLRDLPSPPREGRLKMAIVDVMEMHGGKIDSVRRYDNPIQIGAGR